MGFFVLPLIIVPQLTLHTELQFLKGVGPERAILFKEAYGISTVEQLLLLAPNRYEDRSQTLNLSGHVDGTTGTVVGELGPIETIGAGRKKRLQSILICDGVKLKLLWFRGLSYATKSLKPGATYSAYGKVTGSMGNYSIVHPELKLHNPALAAQTGIIPIYPSTEKALKKGLNSKAIHKIIKANIGDMEHFPKLFPDFVYQAYTIPSTKEVFYNLHCPNNLEDAGKLIWCLKLDELFHHQLLQNHKRMVVQKMHSGHVFNTVGDGFNTFFKEVLPFELTGAQKRVVKEIRLDTKSGKQMNRLLQGDVGSGKTMVAFLSALLAIDNGYQACIMAPTEILAQQHYADFKAYSEKIGLRADILTGSVKGAKRKALLADLAAGEIHILVGTHALIEPPVVFKNLGLVLVDEQHRFGVAQRAKLTEKNTPPPHVLVMTATPIPRTLTMSHYGDLDLSVIDELPPGRKPIKTLHRTDSDRLSIFSFIESEIKLGRQIYIVYPLIEESESMNYKDLMDGYESIVRRFPMPKYQTSIVHGRLDNATKSFEMQRFVKGETNIMVATTVIEVGVNVPNASVMVIESAEKFGLSQLHQLRGRIGRGAEQSYCVLMTKDKLGDDAKERISTMVESNDGFRIAEVDLKLRGPGNVMGTQQSGTSTFRFANIAEDFDLLKLAHQMARKLLSIDPELTLEENKAIKNRLKKALDRASKWVNIG